MTVRRTVVAGGVAGLVVSGAVLVFFWLFGVWRILIGTTNLRVVLWPSSVMLTAGWHTTLLGIMTTVSSIALNCLMYIAIALVLRSCIRSFRRLGG